MSICLAIVGFKQAINKKHIMNSFIRGFFTFSALTLVSRLAGFARDALTAVYLGAGPAADAYAVANRLPNLFRTLFAEGAFNAAFLPLFKKHQHENGISDARAFAAETQAALATFLFVFVGLMIVFMPAVIHIIAPGFDSDGPRFDLAVAFGRITFPYLFFISLTSLQGGVLNALGSFGPFAAAPIILNIVQIIGLTCIVPLTGAPGWVLSWGMAIGGLLQWAWLALACKRLGVPIVWQRPRLSPRVKIFLKKLGPGVVGASAAQVNLAVSTMLGSLLPTGAVAYLYYANQLNQLPLGVVGIALYTALLPHITQAIQQDDAAQVRRTTGQAVQLALVFALPAALGLALLGYPILAVLFARGAFTLNDAAQTAQVLAAYAAGIPAFMLVRIFAVRFFATGDTKTPVRAALVAVAANIAGAVWLLQFMGAPGIALATSIATWTNLALLLWRLKQREGDVPLTDGGVWRKLPRLIAATLAMGGAAYGVSIWLAGYLYGGQFMAQIGALAAVLGAAIVVYAALLQLLGVIRLGELKSLIRR